MRKKMMSMLCAAALAAALTVPAAYADETEVISDEPVVRTMAFEDVHTYNWYYNAVKYVFERDIMTGLNDEVFGSNDKINRAQAVNVLFRMSGEEAPGEYHGSFPDIPEGKWYEKSVAWAKETGVVSGYKTGGFGPYDDITRQDFCIILRNYAEHIETEPEETVEGSYLDMSDAALVSGYAASAVDWAYNRGFIGKGDELNPKGQLTRAEAAAMISRFDESVIAAIEARKDAAIRNFIEEYNTVILPGEVVDSASSADVPAFLKLFENTVVVGDSRAKGAVDTGVLTDNEAVYYGGASVGTLYETVERAAQLMRGKALFIVGMNDLGFYHGDAEWFKAEFIKLIDFYLEMDPDCEIFLQEIIPAAEFGREYWPMMDFRPAFDEAIRQICEEYGYTYVTVNEYALEEYATWSIDGAHYSPDFYLRWVQTVANQMGLWEDLV